ncbi:GntR family transcriptional regulator [Inhella sp.]|uniref:GntR family transcriptional regulator n=1 Tax=Inhella sp. TaxID=1921806 RepID=UPI0035B2F4D9
MLNNWNDSAPIYRQLAQQLAGHLLDGEPAEGQPMPSVRQLAQQYLINPLTVSRALQSLVDEGFLEPRRGLGMYVTEGARRRLMQSERDSFLRDEWPVLRERLRRMGLTAKDLNWEHA